MACDDLLGGRETIEEAAVRLAAALGYGVNEVLAALTRIVLTRK